MSNRFWWIHSPFIVCQLLVGNRLFLWCVSNFSCKILCLVHFVELTSQRNLVKRELICRGISQKKCVHYSNSHYSHHHTVKANHKSETTTYIDSSSLAIFITKLSYLPLHLISNLGRERWLKLILDWPWEARTHAMRRFADLAYAMWPCN